MASWEDINLEEIKTGFVTKGLKDPPSSGGRQSMVTILNTFLDAMEEKLYAVNPGYEPDESYRFEYGTIMNGDADPGNKTFLRKIEYLVKRYYNAWQLGWYTEDALGVYENHDDFRLYNSDLEEVTSEAFVQTLTGGPGNSPYYNMANIWRADFFQGLYVLYGLMRYTKVQGIRRRNIGPETSGYRSWNYDDNGYKTQQKTSKRYYDWVDSSTCVAVDAQGSLDSAFDASLNTLEGTNRSFSIYYQTFQWGAGSNNFYRRISSYATYLYLNRTGIDFVFRKWEDKKCVSNIIHSPIKCEVVRNSVYTSECPYWTGTGGYDPDEYPCSTSETLSDNALPARGGYFQHAELNTEVVSDADKGETLFIQYGDHPPPNPQASITYGSVCPNGGGVNSFRGANSLDLKIASEGYANIVFDSNFPELNFYIEPEV